MQDFLNGVCTHMIWLTEKKLTYYSGEALVPYPFLAVQHDVPSTLCTCAAGFLFL